MPTPLVPISLDVCPNSPNPLGVTHFQANFSGFPLYPWKPLVITHVSHTFLPLSAVFDVRISFCLYVFWDLPRDRQSPKQAWKLCEELGCFIYISYLLCAKSVLSAREPKGNKSVLHKKVGGGGGRGRQPWVPALNIKGGIQLAVAFH